MDLRAFPERLEEAGAVPLGDCLKLFVG